MAFDFLSYDTFTDWNESLKKELMRFISIEKIPEVVKMCADGRPRAVQSSKMRICFKPGTTINKMEFFKAVNDEILQSGFISIYDINPTGKIFNPSDFQAKQSLIIRAIKKYDE